MNAQEKAQHERQWALEDNLVGYLDVRQACLYLGIDPELTHSVKWMDAPDFYLFNMADGMAQLARICELVKSDREIQGKLSRGEEL